MRKFTDKNGLSWTIELNFGAVLRVKTLSDGRYDLLKPERVVTHSEFDQPVPLQTILLLDLPSLWEVLYMIVEPQAEERNVTAQQFAELLRPEELLLAREQFREEWRDFFRGLQRPDQAMALEKTGAWMKEAQEKLKQAMTNNPALAKLDQKVTEAMDATLRNSFGKLEQSLIAIQEYIPGAN